MFFLCFVLDRFNQIVRLLLLNFLPYFLVASLRNRRLPKWHADDSRTKKIRLNDLFMNAEYRSMNVSWPGVAARSKHNGLPHIPNPNQKSFIHISFASGKRLITNTMIYWEHGSVADHSMDAHHFSSSTLYNCVKPNYIQWTPNEANEQANEWLPRIMCFEGFMLYPHILHKMRHRRVCVFSSPFLLPTLSPSVSRREKNHSGSGTRTQNILGSMVATAVAVTLN